VYLDNLSGGTFALLLFLQKWKRRREVISWFRLASRRNANELFKKFAFIKSDKKKFKQKLILAVDLIIAFVFNKTASFVVHFRPTLPKLFLSKKYLKNFFC